MLVALATGLMSLTQSTTCVHKSAHTCTFVSNGLRDKRSVSAIQERDNGKVSEVILLEFGSESGLMASAS